MGNRLKEMCAAAKATYETALVTLERRRQEYEEVALQAGEKKQLKEKLEGRIVSVESELKAAELEFERVFAAAGYERTKAVKDVLNKKAALQDELDALRKAKSDAEYELSVALPRVGVLGRNYGAAHKSALQGFHVWKALEAVADVAPVLVPAIVAVSGVARDNEAGLTLSNANYEDAVKRRVEFIWKELVEEARATHKLGELLPVEEVGVLDLKGFSRNHWMTLMQAHDAERKARERGPAHSER